MGLLADLRINIFEGCKIDDKIQICSKHNYHISISIKNISKDFGIDNSFKKQSNFILDPCANYIEYIDWNLYCKPLGEQPKDLRELKLKSPGKKCSDTIPKKNAITNVETMKITIMVDKEQLKYLPPRPLVFLLLGETGVDKSTFVNYAPYNSLNEAMKNKLKVFFGIPVKFSMVDEGEKLISISSETKYELLATGKSSTQTSPGIGLSLPFANTTTCSIPKNVPIINKKNK
ncbi:hypothetical protein ACTFIZ_000005 [Dictyostelium cf. discoideum]